MSRSVHIAAALIAVFLLVRPFDCFSSGRFDQKAADCCKKGKCSPSNSDDCCKATVQDGNQLVASKAVAHSLPALEIAAVDVPTLTSPLLVASLFVQTHAPPASTAQLRLSVPLLI